MGDSLVQGVGRHLAAMQGKVLLVWENNSDSIRWAYQIRPDQLELLNAKPCLVVNDKAVLIHAHIPECSAVRILDFGIIPSGELSVNLLKVRRLIIFGAIAPGSRAQACAVRTSGGPGP